MDCNLDNGGTEDLIMMTEFGHMTEVYYFNTASSVVCELPNCAPMGKCEST